jgi:segregation and condensation protein A
MEGILQTKNANERVFEVVMQGDEITWQAILFDLVKTGGMDPWAIDIGQLVQQFLDTVNKLHEINFRMNGKVVLASAMLLKIKTSALLEQDINALDQLLAQQDETQLIDPMDEQPGGRQRIQVEGVPKVFPKTPQPRQRQVSIYDLVEALEQALEVNTRRQRRILFSYPEVKIPERKIDLHGAMDGLFSRVQDHYSRTEQRLTFQEMVQGLDKQAVIYTFMPLLHLTTARKTDIEQPEHFSTIYISVAHPDARPAPGTQAGEIPTQVMEVEN